MSMRQLIPTTLALTLLTLVACGGGGVESDTAADTAANTTQAAERVATGLSAPEPTLVDLDPCELLTVEDAEPHLDSFLETKQETRGGMKECQQKGRSFTRVSLQVGGMDLEDFEKKIAANHALMDDVELREIPALGDKAYFLRSLWVQSGDYVLHFEVDSLATKRDDSMQTHRVVAAELAETALGRL